MKKILAVLSVVSLLVASAASYAEYCVFAYKACVVRVGAASECPHEMVKVEPVKARGCGGVVRCEAVRSCKEIDPCKAVEKCADKEDCKPKFCRARLPLEADRPNRIAPQTPPALECGSVHFQSNLYALDVESARILQPPRGLHPCIATSVLRI